MSTQTITYQQILRTQKAILGELTQLKNKFRLLSSVERFDKLANKGRKFARQRGITRTQVLKDD